MKTKASFTIFKLTTLAPFAVALTALLITQPVFAFQTTNSIVITENSSTDLTATYTLFDGTTEGVTVTPNPGIGPDLWTLTFPASVVLNGRFTAWIEPENPSLGNEVQFTGGSTLNVLSDVSKGTLPTVMDEGTLSNVGFDTSNQFSISVTFDDDGDVATTAPDTGSTFGLLFLALTALFGANRLRSIRLA